MHAKADFHRETPTENHITVKMPRMKATSNTTYFSQINRAAPLLVPEAVARPGFMLDPDGIAE